MQSRIASLYVQIVPQAKGFFNTLLAQVNPAATQAGNTAGRSLGSSMGTSAGSSIYKSVTNGPFSRSLNSAISTASKATSNIFEKSLNFGKIDLGLGSFTSTLGSGLKDVFGSLNGQLSNFVAGFGSANAAGSSFTGIMGDLGGVIRTALIPLENLGRNIFTIASSGLSKLTGGIGNLFNRVRSTFGKISGLAGKLFSPLASTGSRVLNSLINPFRNLVSGFSNSSAAASSLTGMMGTLGGKLRVLISPFEKLGRSTVGGVVNGFRNLVSGMKSSTAAGSALTGTMGTLGGKIGGVFRSAITPLRNFTDGFKNSGAGATVFYGLMDKLGDRVGKATTKMKDFGKSVGGYVAGPLLNVGKTFGSVIKTLGQKLGLNTAFSTLGTNLSNVFKNAGGKVGGLLFSGLGKAASGMGALVSTSLLAPLRISAKALDIFSGLAVGAGKAGIAIGGTIATGVSNAMKGAGIGAAVAASVATAFVASKVVGGGISRSLNIEDAEAKLKALKFSASDIKNISASAMDSVVGTTYAFDGAMKIASSSIAAGVNKGDDLTNYLKLVADTATVSGGSLEDIGYIFNKIQGNGTAYAQELNMLADRGIPIYAWMAKQAGISIKELRDNIRDGKVSAEDFRKAVNENIGGAATTAANTTRGVIANTNNAFARLGSNLFGPSTVLLRESLLAIIPVIDALTARTKDGAASWWDGLSAKALPAIKSWAEQAKMVISGEAGFLTLFGSFGKTIDSVITKVGELWAKFGASPVGQMIGGWVQSFGAFYDKVGGIGGIFSTLASNLGGSFDGIISQITSNFTNLISIIMPIISQVITALIPIYLSMQTMLVDIFGSLANDLLPLILPMIKIIGDALGSLIPVIAGSVGEVITGAVAMIVEIMPALVEMISSVMIIVGELLVSLVPALMEIIPIIAGMVIDIIPLIASLLAALIPIIIGIVPMIADIVVGLLPVIVTLTKILGDVISLIVEMLVPIIDMLAPILEEILLMLDPIIKALVPIIEIILMLAIVIIQALMPVLKVLIPIIGGILWIIAEVLKGVVVLIAVVLVSFVNGLIFIWNAIAMVLNALSFNTPDWLSDLMGVAKGGKIGFNLAMVEPMAMPGLAKGGIVHPRNGGTGVILAEAGKAEAVTDLGLTNSMMRDTKNLVNQAQAGKLGNGSELPPVQIIVNPSAGMSEEQLAKKIDKIYRRNARLV